MKEAGMAVKSRIEGPPVCECPILLRQTSFLALEEGVQFLKDDNMRDSPILSDHSLIKAKHKARFGEIEERGAAVTRKGRDLYDRLLSESMKRAVDATGDEADAITQCIFKEYPDDWDEMRKQCLIYCEYRCVRKPL